MTNKQKIVVTAALPYANGSIHLGHMVEYIQADIYVRALKLLGKKAILCCADDTHGAPIELKAMQLKIAPEALIAKYFIEHTKDFSDFLIHFDSYSSTNTKENQYWSDFIYGKLKEKNLIYKKEMDVIYCAHCKRFLPDRYVKGTCPACKAKDQYGDVCEHCGKTHKTTDLLEPKCSLCGKTPETKKSEHLFFKLSAFKEKLETFFKTATLQDEVKHFVENWLADLKDWCISRDGPYFGFPIPGEKNKYYYVWIDAPICYISSTEQYCKTNNEKLEDYWHAKNGKIIHIIGKDIMYFHLLFWPAMLQTAGFSLPEQVMVHGFLTVNKEKMSKSRGTFITARQYLNCLHPEYLRFYYALHLTPKLADINFDTKHFKEVVNNELIGNIANFCNRTLTFADQHFKKELISYNGLQIEEKEKIIAEKIKTIQQHYETFNFKDAVKEMGEITAIGNKFFQENEPWNLIKSENPEDKNKAHAVISCCVSIIKKVSILLSPVLPSFMAALQKQLGYQQSLVWEDLEKPMHNKITASGIILKKLDKEIDQLVVQEQKTAEAAEFPLELRVGKIISVEQHHDAGKLYIERIDFGDHQRTIVSGLKEHMSADQLLNKNVVVVCNLEPAKLRGVISEGMLLTGEKDGKLALLEAEHAKPGDLAFVGKKPAAFKRIDYKAFSKVVMTIQNKKVAVQGYLEPLHTDKGDILVNITDGARVC